MKKKEDKPAALDHALYEIEMLVHALVALSRPGISSSEGSGWLEVFATHARNLNEFFAAKDFGGAYMKPSHFVTWSHSYVFDADLARRASSQISHLTYDRERPEEKTPWPFARHFEALRDPALVFLTAVRERDALMAYQSNRTRTDGLLDVLPKIRFK